MEGTAAPEQAEPQGSAAPDVALIPSDVGDSSQRQSSERPLSGYAQMRQALEARVATPSNGHSTNRETSATDEQPASAASQDGTPEASADGDEHVDVSSPATDQPRLSRSQRRAQKQGTDNGTAAQPAATDTSAQPAPVTETDPVQRVERAVADGLGRLEALIRGPNPSQSDPSLEAASRAYQTTFGNDAEFTRRALIATRPSGDVYLNVDEAAELERWSNNRETKAQIDGNYQRNLTAIAAQKAQAHGIDPQSVLSTPQFGDTYDLFVAHGKSLGAKEAETKVAERLSKLESANRQLADENEALRQRVPGSARQVLTGGVSASSRTAATANRQNLTGRDLMRRAMETSGPRRPGGRP